MVGEEQPCSWLNIHARYWQPDSMRKEGQEELGPTNCAEGCRVTFVASSEPWIAVTSSARQHVYSINVGFA
jgi:hypothetical protein